MSVLLLDSKVLLDNSKVATSANCCCGDCDCCPPYAIFPISGDITISFDGELIPDWRRQYGQGATLSFTGTVDGDNTGQYHGGFNTDCTCSCSPAECSDQCRTEPETCTSCFGPSCVPDKCTPPESFGPPFDCCLSLVTFVNLWCFPDDTFFPAGWYLNVGTGSTNICGGSLGWGTDIDGSNTIPSYIQVSNDCSVLPTGLFSLDLEPEVGGTAHINLTIDAPVGSCCQSYGNCVEITEEECTGTWHCAGTFCEENDPTGDFGVTGACCFMGTCFDNTDQASCDISGGIFKGHCTDCAHETC